MKAAVAIVYAAMVVSLPLPVVAVDGHQWQELVKDWKVMYITGVIESWMHEANLAELLKNKVPETSTGLGTTFETFMPCLKDKKPSPAHVVELVDRYVEEHPKQLSSSMAAIVWTTVYEFCR
ncbi:MAG TPA: hypothetical protein VJ692_16440 [Nitrospiraceae bacterium]|nr:hypothetical protein [Nitrospiraceae bacterium]